MAKISKSWGDTFAELPTGKVAADAMIGGGVGMGANYMSNNSSGDSGGYLQAGLIGGALGGVTRGVLAKSRGEAVVAGSKSLDIPSPVPSEPGILSRFATGVKNKATSVYGTIEDAAHKTVSNTNIGQKISEGVSNNMFKAQSLSTDMFSPPALKDIDRYRPPVNGYAASRQQSPMSFIPTEGEVSKGMQLGLPSKEAFDQLLNQSSKYNPYNMDSILLPQIKGLPTQSKNLLDYT